jgi:hypothetical protein
MGFGKSKKLRPTSNSPVPSPEFYMPLKNVSLKERKTDADHVLDEETAQEVSFSFSKLRNLFTPMFKESFHWKLTYSMSQHGISITTLYANCSNAEGPCVLAVKDVHGCVYGAYLSESPKSTSGFYGNGQCFLWRNRKAGGLQVFMSTGKNEYYILSNQGKCLAIGGG